MIRTVYSPLFPQNLQILPPIYVQFKSFWQNLRVYCSPYFDHDALMMHHALHVLDTSDSPFGWPCVCYKFYLLLIIRFLLILTGLSLVARCYSWRFWRRFYLLRGTEAGRYLPGNSSTGCVRTEWLEGLFRETTKPCCSGKEGLKPFFLLDRFNVFYRALCPEEMQKVHIAVTFHSVR